MISEVPERFSPAPVSRRSFLSHANMDTFQTPFMASFAGRASRDYAFPFLCGGTLSHTAFHSCKNSPGPVFSDRTRLASYCRSSGSSDTDASHYRGALLVGSGLAVSGASFQGIFHNPLVSPYILGVASGAAFGAALGILFSLGTVMLHATSLLFGILAVMLTFAIGRARSNAPPLVLVLSGVVVGSFFSALISTIKYVADPFEKLPTIVFWLMGSLSRITPDLIAVAAPLMGIGMLSLGAMRWRIKHSFPWRGRGSCSWH